LIKPSPEEKTSKKLNGLKAIFLLLSSQLAKEESWKLSILSSTTEPMLLIFQKNMNALPS